MSFPAYLAYQDSGVSWIGPVPAGWSVKRLRFLAQVQTGIAKGKDVQGIETIRVPYLRVANVQDGFIDIDDVSEIEIAATDLGRYLLRPGDVLMNEGGDFDKLGRGRHLRRPDPETGSGEVRLSRSVLKCSLSKYGFLASGVRTGASTDRPETGL